MSLLELPAAPTAPGSARAHTRRLLAEWDLLDLTDTVVLLVSELVTNAVLHTGSASSLLVERDGEGVRITVSDASPVLPVQRHSSTTATTGRGVQLLQDLADSWGAQPVEGGKQVWCVVTGSQDPWAGLDADTLLAQAEL
ncbi:MAG: putative sensor protein [Frankiales bacterium]|nr:putative sensor protein [Frankiales bacterium]